MSIKASFSIVFGLTIAISTMSTVSALEASVASIADEIRASQELELAQELLVALQRIRVIELEAVENAALERGFEKIAAVAVEAKEATEEKAFKQAAFLKAIEVAESAKLVKAPTIETIAEAIYEEQAMAVEAAAKLAAEEAKSAADEAMDKEKNKYLELGKILQSTESSLCARDESELAEKRWESQALKEVFRVAEIARRAAEVSKKMVADKVKAKYEELRSQG